MKPWDTQLPWQQQNWQHLSAYLQQNRPPQALLISGIKGVGKTLLAKQFANTILCEDVNEYGLYCRVCKACQLFNAETHPDFFSLRVSEKSKTISIQQIREMTAELTLKPQFASFRVVIIKAAETMSPAAANAFLKTLEEPGNDNVILLVSAKPYLLPATIISRCQKMIVQTPDPTLARNWLTQQLSEGIDVDSLLDMTYGAPLLAFQYAESDLSQRKLQCIKGLQALAIQQTSPLLLAEQWQDITPEQVVDWLMSSVNMICKYQVLAGEQQAIRTELEENLKQMAFKLDLKKLLEFYDYLVLMKKMQQTQANNLLMLEEILIRWQQMIN